MKDKLPTTSYKGVRDFYPKEMFVQDYIFSVWHDVLQSFGYEHYSASILEPAELYEGKTSEEIVNDQTYTFTDRGDRRVTLRPEMTPTVARMVAGKSRELSFPLRWYSIPNVFRYERPQKGRLREHWQLNVDMFGLDNLEAESELIEISSAIMNRFGLNDSDFVVKVNDRKILNEIMNDLNLDDEKKKQFRILLDKKEKMDGDDFNRKMQELIGKPFNTEIRPNDTVEKLIKNLNDRGINNIVFDPLMIRGFDYYTGIVFEIFDTHRENNRSLFGGGRYDNLLDMFGVEKIPTVGFGMGDVTINDALSTRNLLPTNIASAHLAICTLDTTTHSYASILARELRSEGVDVVVNYGNKKVGDQIKQAVKAGVPFVICVGEEEISSDRLVVKTLESGEEKKLSRNKVAKFVKNSLEG